MVLASCAVTTIRQDLMTTLLIGYPCAGRQWTNQRGGAGRRQGWEGTSKVVFTTGGYGAGGLGDVTGNNTLATKRLNKARGTGRGYRVGKVAAAPVITPAALLHSQTDGEPSVWQRAARYDITHDLDGPVHESAKESDRFAQRIGGGWADPHHLIAGGTLRGQASDARSQARGG